MATGSFTGITGLERHPYTAATPRNRDAMHERQQQGICFDHRFMTKRVS
ncbi:hypothetical protein LPU83_pLPU83c_0433 (plasmid) [Rhizobium favelukesii]|uniref:Uncharacterized protein n=1 Tax=Rhizobium favelukesii TaxID=348824 RepID=W6RL77_9HYPH|nr:hypothetical protein LPU83_pLPU83c_0433 [Rhizobium favelukesii]